MPFPSPLRGVLLAALLSLPGCYASRGSAAHDVPPASGVWHLEYLGDGAESKDYRVDFNPNGDVIVFDGEVRRSFGAQTFVTDAGPNSKSRLYESPAHWTGGKAVLHTLNEFTDNGLLLAREYTLAVQDPHLLVGKVAVVVRTNGIFSRYEYQAKATYLHR